MRRAFLAAVLATFAFGAAMAQDTCESKAVSKDGKPLFGAAKKLVEIAWRSAGLFQHCGVTVIAQIRIAGALERQRADHGT